MSVTFPFPDAPPPGEAACVAPGVHWIRMPLPISLDHINLWLIEDGDGWTVVDTGLGRDQIRQYWESIFAGTMKGRPVKRIIVTHMHPDHSGQAGWMSRHWNASLWMTREEYLLMRVMASDSFGMLHDAMRQFMQSCGISSQQLEETDTIIAGRFGQSVDHSPSTYRRIRDGETFSIGGRAWQVVVGRGHSPEHACLLCPELQVLISGDQVLPRITSNVSVHPLEPEGNPMREWLESIDRMSALPAELLVLPAHNLPFYGIRPRLDFLRKHHEERLEAVLGAATRPLATVDFLSVLFQRDFNGPQFILALGEARAHLHLLVWRGLMRCEVDPNGVHFFQRLVA